MLCFVPTVTALNASQFKKKRQTISNMNHLEMSFFSPLRNVYLPNLTVIKHLAGDGIFDLSIGHTDFGAHGH